MGRTVIDVPMKEVVTFLENHDRRHEWDLYVTVGQSVEITLIMCISSTLLLYLGNKGNETNIGHRCYL